MNCWRMMPCGSPFAFWVPEIDAGPAAALVAYRLALYIVQPGNQNSPFGPTSWVLVKELNLSYHNKGIIVFTLDPDEGNLT